MAGQNTKHFRDTHCTDLFDKQMKGIQGFQMHLLPSTLALGATCSNVCPVPGRLHSASSYSGARKSRHYRVGDPRTRSRDRFTLKAMAKGGAFMRREKKRSIKEGIAVNPEMQKPNILPKIFAKHFEGKRSQKNLESNTDEGQRQGLSRVSGTSRGVSLKKSQLRTNSLILRSHLKS